MYMAYQIFKTLLNISFKVVDELIVSKGTGRSGSVVELSPRDRYIMRSSPVLAPGRVKPKTLK